MRNDMKNSLLVVLAVAAFLTLTAAGASRYVNGTEIPQAVTLLYSTGSQSATLGASTATSLGVSGAVGITGALTVTGATTHVGAVTFSAPPLFASAETGLTAHAGGTQAAALALSATKFMHQVTTVGTAADSVALPAPVLGTCHLIVNEAASNAMQVFAVTPATVNGVTTATGVSLSAKKGMMCCAASTTDYACTGPN
jgi:hypothetical protein